MSNTSIMPRHSAYALFAVGLSLGSTSIMAAAAVLINNNKKRSQKENQYNIHSIALTGLTNSSFRYLWNYGSERDVMLFCFLPKQKVKKLWEIVYPFYKRYRWCNILGQIVKYLLKIRIRYTYLRLMLWII